MRQVGYIGIAVILVALLVQHQATIAQGFVDLYVNGTLIAQRAGINIIGGDGITVTGADDGANNRSNATITADVTADSTTTFTNKTMDADNNTFSNFRIGDEVLATVTSTMTLIDAVRLQLGTGADAQMYFDGTNMFTTSTVAMQFQIDADTQSQEILGLFNDRENPADEDTANLSFYVNDSAGDKTEAVRFRGGLWNNTDTDERGMIIVDAVDTAGSFFEIFAFINNSPSNGNFRVNNDKNNVDTNIWGTDSDDPMIHVDASVNRVSLRDQATSAGVFQVWSKDNSDTTPVFTIVNNATVTVGSTNSGSNVTLNVQNRLATNVFAFNTSNETATLGSKATIKTNDTPSSGNGYLIFGNSTAPTGMQTSTAGLFADNVGPTTHLWGIDSDDNAVQLTSHPRGYLDSLSDACAYPWAEHARNEYLGVEIFVDACGAVLAVMELYQILGLDAPQLIQVNEIPTRDWYTDHPDEDPPYWMRLRNPNLQAAFCERNPGDADCL